MDRGDWFLVVASVFIGAVLTLGIEVVRSQLERWQRRKDRREDFQRTTLVEVQDALYDLSNKVQPLMYERAAHFAATGSWPSQSIGPSWDAEIGNAFRRLTRFIVLVNDDKARSLLREAQHSFHRVIEATSGEEAISEAQKVKEALDNANDRIGELLRDL